MYPPGVRRDLHSWIGSLPTLITLEIVTIGSGCEVLFVQIGVTSSVSALGGTEHVTLLARHDDAATIHRTSRAVRALFIG